MQSQVMEQAVQPAVHFVQCVQKVQTLWAVQFVHPAVQAVQAVQFVHPAVQAVQAVQFEHPAVQAVQAVQFVHWAVHAVQAVQWVQSVQCVQPALHVPTTPQIEPTPQPVAGF